MTTVRTFKTYQHGSRLLPAGQLGSCTKKEEHIDGQAGISDADTTQDNAISSEAVDSSNPTGIAEALCTTDTTIADASVLTHSE